MKIVADENMPLVKELFSPYGEVVTIPGRDLGPEQVNDADVLLVRSVTPVNAKLLDGSSVRFVGSATIGTDHVDQAYLQQQGIRFTNAPGCNANAVVQYVLSVLFTLRPNWMSQTVGIVGCGNVGGRLFQTLQKLGVNCRCYDPFLDKAENAHLVSFEEVIQSDILCLHTPLTTDGLYPTFHLFNETVLAQLASNTLLINAGRGAVVDNQALLGVMQQQSLQVALDVWEGEPNILLPLLERVDIGTPHIAGYSYDGKVNGTTMVRDAFCAWMGKEVTEPTLGLRQEQLIDLSVSKSAEVLSDAVLSTFDVVLEDQRMRNALLGQRKDVNQSERADLVRKEGQAKKEKNFDQLRRTCPKRLEFNHFRVQGSFLTQENIRAQGRCDEKDVANLKALGFTVSD